MYCLKKVGGTRKLFDSQTHTHKNKKVVSQISNLSHYETDLGGSSNVLFRRFFVAVGVWVNSRPKNYLGTKKCKFLHSQ